MRGDTAMLIVVLAIAALGIVLNFAVEPVF